MPEWEDITAINYIRIERVAVYEMVKDHFQDYIAYCQWAGVYKESAMIHTWVGYR